MRIISKYGGSTLLLGIFLFISPVLSNIFTGIFHKERLVLYTFLFLSLFLFFLMFRKRKFIGEFVSLTFIDISIIIYLFYGLLNSIFIAKLQFDFFVFFKWGLFFLFYILTKYKCYKEIDKNIIILSITLSGVLESVFSIGQFLDLWESVHPLFTVTGHFNNPGPLGGYLSVCLIFSIYLLFDVKWTKRKYLKFLCAFFVFINASGLFLSDSRAGWLGGLGGLFFYYFYCEKKYKRPLLISAVLIFTIISVFLYLYRSESANARLLIWRVSMNMIIDQPVLGNGIGAFVRKYMFYQADYFNRTPNSYFVDIADNPIYPYNEFVHLTIEIGLLGFFLFLVILFFSFTKSIKEKTNIAFKSAMITLVLFSFFSYPVDVFSLFILFGLFLASIKGKVVIKLRSFFLNRIGVILLLFGLLFSCQRIFFYDKMAEEIGNLTYREHSEPSEFILFNYENVKYNYAFNIVYHTWLANTSNSVTDLKYLENIYPTSETYCSIGSFYFKLRMFRDAEYCFKKASDMVPTRIKPNYNLWKLYIEVQDSMQINNMCDKILFQPLKVENTYTKFVKSEIYKYQNNQ